MGRKNGRMDNVHSWQRTRKEELNHFSSKNKFFPSPTVYNCIHSDSPDMLLLALKPGQAKHCNSLLPSLLQIHHASPNLRVPDIRQRKVHLNFQLTSIAVIPG